MLSVQTRGFASGARQKIACGAVAQLCQGPKAHQCPAIGGVPSPTTTLQACTCCLRPSGGSGAPGFQLNRVPRARALSHSAPTLFCFFLSSFFFLSLSLSLSVCLSPSLLCLSVRLCGVIACMRASYVLAEPELDRTPSLHRRSRLRRLMAATSLSATPGATPQYTKCCGPVTNIIIPTRGMG